jgi:hypothetical protein
VLDTVKQWSQCGRGRTIVVSPLFYVERRRHKTPGRETHGVVGNRDQQSVLTVSSSLPKNTVDSIDIQTTKKNRCAERFSNFFLSPIFCT